MERRDKNDMKNHIGERSCYSPFKRVVAMILVICLTLTMTGCVNSDGESLTLFGALLGLVQGFLVGIGGLIIAGIAWVLEQATGWQNQWTGWCMCGVSAFLFKSWSKLIDPTGFFGDWSHMTKNDISFHDEHVESPSKTNNDEGNLLVQTGRSDRFLANGRVPGEGEILITYDVSGGYDGPKDQIFTVDGEQPISTQIPFRPGYHFDGWALYPNSTGGIYDPGQETDKYLTELRLTEDTVLYAVWIVHDTILIDAEHDYTVTRKWRSPYVSITCSCGLNIVDRTITREEFMYCYFNDIVDDKARGVSKMETLYDLYRAQDIGPLALQLNTEFYNGKLANLDQATDNAIAAAASVKSDIDEICGDIKDVVDQLHYEDGEIDLGQKEFTEMVGKDRMAWTADFFDDIINGTEKAGFALGVIKSAVALGKMSDENRNILEQTTGMLEFVESVSAFTKVGDIISSVTNVLGESLKLVGKMEKAQNIRLAAYTKLYDDNPNLNAMYSEYLAHFFFPGEETSKNVYPYGYLNQLLTGTEKGCWCDQNPSACDFGEATYASAPSVMEILDRIPTAPANASQMEEDILMFYLAERAAHELYVASGLTLEEYAKLIK